MFNKEEALNNAYNMFVDSCLISLRGVGVTPKKTREEILQFVVDKDRESPESFYLGWGAIAELTFCFAAGGDPTGMKQSNPEENENALV